jgi:ribosomal protein S18 acetylase RimI-like enzyme
MPPEPLPGGLLFRAALAADVPAVVALVESAYRGERSRQGWTTEADLLDGQRTDVAAVSELIARPGSTIVLAERAGQLLASAHIELKGEDCAFGMFAVRPDLQGQGIGDALLAECERRARAAGACRMTMTVIWTRAELIAWYQRRGYQATGERQPFPYGDARFGLPKRQDLHFLAYAKPLAGDDDAG